MSLPDRPSLPRGKPTLPLLPSLQQPLLPSLQQPLFIIEPKPAPRKPKPKALRKDAAARGPV
jgi:hypothetical protein